MPVNIITIKDTMPTPIKKCKSLKSSFFIITLVRVNLTVIHKAIPERQAGKLLCALFGYFNQHQAEALATVCVHAMIDFLNRVRVKAVVSISEPCVSCALCYCVGVLFPVLWA